MAINILQELNLGSAKPSFSRDEVASLADIKNLDVAAKYPNNYEIYCREDGCKYRLNKVAHSTMQDNLPHPTGKWRRSDAVISSTMPAPITTGDVILYLGPTVIDPSDQTKIKYQTGKYYRTEWDKTSKQMYAFTQTVESNAPITVIDDGSGNQSAGSSTETKVWYSDTLDIATDTVLFTPDGEGALFENREHAIIVKSAWDGESAITDYVYGDGSADAKPELTRDNSKDEFFDSYPVLAWKLFDTEAEVKEAAANAENALEKATRMDSLTDEMISEITEARENVKEFIYGGNMDGFVEVYNREAEYMYEMDLEKQKSSTDIASYFYNSDDFTSREYTTDDGLSYTLYVFSGPAYYFVPFPTDAIDCYLTSAAEEGKMNYENRIADASGSEEALETLNRAFVTSAVNDNKCLLVSNTILLNAENEEETRIVSATELDNILTNDVEVTLGTYSCDTFTYDIDEVYVGLSIYPDALKMIHDFKPEQEQSEEFEMYSKMFKLMYDYNDGNMAYLRIGERNTENPSENHIRITLGDEEFFGGLKDYLLSSALRNVEQMFNEAGVPYTEEAALEYLRVRLNIISYIHIHRDNEAILDVNSLYDSNLSNSLAEHIRVLGGDKNFIDRTNEGLQSLKTNLKNSKAETKKSISEIKTNMSDMRTKIENTDSKIENTDSKIESRLPGRTADFIKDNIFATKSVELSEAPSYFDGQDFDRTTYTSLIGLGVETYSLSSTSGSISPEFVNYCDESRDDLVAPTDFIVYDKDSQGEINYPWDSFVGILGTIEYDQDLGAALSGYKIQYDRNKTLNFRWDKDDNFYKLSVADVYINTNTSRDADDVHNSGWVLVEPGTDLGEAFANIAGDTSYTKYAQIIIVVNAHPEDTYSESLDFVVDNFDKVFNDLLSIENYKLDPIDMSSYDTRLDKIIKLYTPKYKRLNWTDSYSGEPYYYNSMINLGIYEYNPENDGYTLNPTFMNYLTYGHPGDPTYAAAIEAMISNKYVGINTYLEKDYSTMNLLKEASKKMTVRFDKNASTIGILKDDESGSIYYGITLSIKDVYITISNSDNALAPYTACTPIRIASGGNIYDYIKDLSISGSLFYIGLIFIVEVNKTNSTPSLTHRLSQVEFDRAINELCEVSYNVARNAEDKVSELGDISTITNRVSTLEDNMSGLSELSQLIDKHPAQILIGNETAGYTYNGLIDLGLDSFDPASTEVPPIQPTHKDYYSSSKTINASTLFVSDKYIGVCAYIDSLYNPAETVKDAMKDIVIRYKKDSTALAYVGTNTTPDNITLSIKDVYMAVSTTNYAVAIAYSFGYTKFRIPENDTTSIYEYIKDLNFGSPAVVEFIFIFEVVPSKGYVMSADYYLPNIDFARAINQLCEISLNKVRDAEGKAQKAIENMSSVTNSVNDISDSMSDYMSAKWLPTPIAFPDTAYESGFALDGKDFDFLLYPTFVDTPHSKGSSVEGENSKYTVYPMPESGENTTVKALYESENSMYLLFGFFGERLLPESLGGDYAIPETYNENTIESFNRVSKTLWYSDIYMNMQNTFVHSMIKGVNDSLYEIDISNVFLNFDPRVIKSLYAKVTSTPNLLANPSYTNPDLATMDEFVKIPYANTQDINTISMEDIVNMCGRPYKTETLGSSKAIVLFVAEINKNSFPALASLTTPAYGVSPTTSDNFAIYQAMFVNNESSPIYMARSIDDSLKKTKEVAVEAARYAAATLTAAREYSSYSDLKISINEGESGYVTRVGETEGTTVADVYIKTVEGALIKIASGVEYEAPVSQSQGPSIVIDDGN